MGEKINISIEIAERPYKLSVSRDQESVVRKAADLINRTIKKYSDTYNYKDYQDLFAMVALQEATKSLNLENEKEFREKGMIKKLTELEEILTTHLEGED